MESLLAHIARKERHRLRVVQVDLDKRGDVAGRLGVEVAPTLVLIRSKRPVARIEGRASAPRIEAMLEEHLEAEATKLTCSERPTTMDVCAAASSPSA